jgi:hypothetical protein
MPLLYPNSAKTKAHNVKSLTGHVTKPRSRTYLGMIKNVNKICKDQALLLTDKKLERLPYTGMFP